MYINILVLNIIEDNNKDNFLVGKKFKYVKDVYKTPCKSNGQLQTCYIKYEKFLIGIVAL